MTAAIAKIAPRKWRVAITFSVAKKRSATIPTKKGDIMLAMAVEAYASGISVEENPL